MKIKESALALAVTLATSTAAMAQDAIPVVPASVMKTANEQARMVAVNTGTQERAGRTNQMRGAAISEEAVLTMTPGVNQIIPVAIGHPNRIVTPFGNPEVVSTSLSGGQKEGECGEVCIKDNVVYVATDKEHPVTMFITEKGSETQALSLTMVPRKIPPREVFLKMDGQSIAGGLYSSPKAEKWEKSQPYVETIRTVFRKLALGEIPQGYTMTEVPDTVAPPVCDQPGIEASFREGQMVIGHSLSVFVGVAENVSGNAVEFQEATCGDWDVAAVTTWPHKVLEPGQKTEVYIARKEIKGKAPSSKRPSLLSGGAQ